MAEKTAKSDIGEGGFVDLDNDERWQERLAEARERRAQALKAQGRTDNAPRSPKKPWEETPPSVRPVEDKPAVNTEKDFDFLYRLSVLKRVTGRDDTEDLGPPHLASKAGRNWYPGAADNSDNFATAPAEIETQTNQVDSEHKGTGPMAAGPRKSVDDFFDEPATNYGESEAPASLLLQPTEPSPPSSASRPWLQYQTEPEEVAAITETSTVTVAANSNSERGSKKSFLARWAGPAGVFLIAAAAGPLFVYAPWQERATGPAIPIFGLEPALELTTPFVAFPPSTSPYEWQSWSVGAPNGPLGIHRNLPPQFVRSINPFDVPAPSNEAAVGVDLLLQTDAIAVAQRTAPDVPQLTLSNLDLAFTEWTRRDALPALLADVSIDAIKPVPRPEDRALTQ